MSFLADPRSWISLLTVLGFGLPAWGLWGAYGHARSTLSALTRKHEKGLEYSSQLHAILDQPGLTQAERVAAEGEHDARLEAEGIETVTAGGFPFLSLQAEVATWRAVLDGVKGDLAWVGLGLVAATAASLWSLWV